MEILYSSLLGFLLFLVMIFLFHNHKSSGNANLPPGKAGFPVIGETLEFLSTAWKGHPEKFISDRIAKYSSNIFKTSLLGSPVVAFCGASANQFLFSNENKLVQVWFPRAFDKIFLTSTQVSTGEESIKVRKFPRHLLKTEVLQASYIGSMDSISHSYFASCLEKRDKVVVLPFAKQFIFLLVCRLMMSVEDPNLVSLLEKAFGVLFKGIFSLPINLPGTPLNRGIKASTLIRKELSVIIKQRKIDLAEGRASPTQDVLSHMILTSDDSGNAMHDEDAIASMMFALILASYESTAVVCTCTVKYLAELPEVYQGVYQEQLEIAKVKAPGELLNWKDFQKMKYSWNVVCEVMRLTPPNLGGFREALTDFTYNGFSIRKGWKLYFNPYSTHIDPELFPEPEKFDPSRFEDRGPAPHTYVPFGGGPRMCPGKDFARLEILVFIHHLVKRFRWEKLIHDEKIVYNTFAVPEKGLPIRLFPHEVKPSY